MTPLEEAGRTIIIGDVHGCYAELQDLLRAVKASPSDRLISVGDLIGKGPDSLSVMRWAMSVQNLACVRGNHELRFLEHWRRGEQSEEKSYDEETYRQLGADLDRCMRFASRWPLYIEDEYCLVVHAGLMPDVPLNRQGEWELANLRRLPQTGRAWYESYNGDRLVVFGHWARPEPIVRDNAIGLDTGCVYGGELSALILPTREIISVPARRVYRKKSGWPERRVAA